MGIEGIFEWDIEGNDPLSRVAKFSIEMNSRFSNCYPVDANANVVEDKFLHGQWLILLFAVWSGPDRIAVRVAALVSELVDDFRVAIQPFDVYEQNVKWSSDMINEYQSPIWLVMKNGHVLGKFVGARPPQDVIEKTLAIFKEQNAD